MQLHPDQDNADRLELARNCRRLSLREAASVTQLSKQVLLTKVNNGKGPHLTEIDGMLAFLEPDVIEWHRSEQSKPARKRARPWTQDDEEPSISDLIASLAKPDDGGAGAPPTTA